jgi:glycosyltransferase involved in cell wall biosynthesis
MEQKRSIIIVGSAYPLRGGGISTFNERLARAYQDLGDEVSIFTFSLQYPAVFFPGTTQYSSEAPPEGLDIKVRINSINPLTWWKTGREIRKLKPDLVVIRFWIPFMAPCLGTIARIIRRAGIKVVAIVDNIIPHEKKLLDRKLAQYFVNSIDYFIAMSQSVMDELEHFDDRKPRKLTVHPLYDNFGDPISRKEALTILDLKPDCKYILFFGFIREYKGLDLLLKAFADSRFSSLPVKLLVVGEFYTDAAPYHTLIEEGKIADRVIMHNQFIPNDEVVNYFCAASLVVQPYKDATQSGITQIAYHFNKPMITTNVGGLSETIADGRVGFVVDPDSRQIADAMYRYFQEELEMAFTAKVKEEKKRFSWKTMTDAIDEVTK